MVLPDEPPKSAPVVKPGDVVVFTLDRGAVVEVLPATVVRQHPDLACHLSIHGAGRYLEAAHASWSPRGVPGTWASR